jgi:hypothetical protein
VTSATRRMRPPQRGHARTSIAKQLGPRPVPRPGRLRRLLRFSSPFGRDRRPGDDLHFGPTRGVGPP